MAIFQFAMLDYQRVTFEMGWFSTVKGAKGSKGKFDFGRSGWKLIGRDRDLNNKAIQCYTM